MKTEETTIEPNTKYELKNLKFVNSEIYTNTCDIKGEPISNIDCDEFSFSIIFPTNVSEEKAGDISKEIVRAVNMYNILIKQLELCANGLAHSVCIVPNDWKDAVRKLKDETRELLKKANQK